MTDEDGLAAAGQQLPRGLVGRRRGPDGEQIKAAGRVKLIGGTGQDTLTLPADTGDVYLGTVTEDLEQGDDF